MTGPSDEFITRAYQLPDLCNSAFLYGVAPLSAPGRTTPLLGNIWGSGVEPQINPRVMPYLTGLSSQFTTYTLLDCGRINSVRVIRLYESLCQYRSSGIWITSALWLAERYELPDSQRANFAEMKRTFLVPAIEKINTLTPLKVSMTEANGKLVFSILARPLQMPPQNV